MSNTISKEDILSELHKIIDQKIEIATHAIESAKESRDSDTKSSAGDKYETGREMMQIEIDKNTVQLSNAKYLKVEISKIDCKKKYDKTEFGSLVLTTQGIYFMSIGIGKLVLDNKNIFIISINSPIGKIIQNKRIGDCFHFQNSKIVITNIL